MTAQNQRDPDGTDILGQVRDGLADLKANVVSRWGRVPHVAADPTTLADGMAWVRSDNGNISWRANGVTYPTAWTAVTFNGTWANFGGAFGTVTYRRVGDVVQLRGLSLAGVAPPGLVFTLPAGYRPTATVLFNILGNGAVPAVRVDVTTTGTVTITGPVAGVAYSFDNAQFSTI